MDMSPTGSGVLGIPPATVRTTPWPRPTPTASQEVGDPQETDRMALVPLTVWGVPGDPLVTVTTIPWPSRELAPTASHEVAVAHEMP